MRPWDITVHDQRFYAKVIRGGSLALGETYMDRLWDCPALDEMFSRLLAGGIESPTNSGFLRSVGRLLGNLRNRQSRSRSKRVGESHYDAGNELYFHMLGDRLAYSCAYWNNAATLAEAQEAKLDLICRKIGLRPGLRVLDIGCGWGSFAVFAAQRYGASVVGTTISKEQAQLAREKARGLPVEIRFEDYRDTHGEFDRIVSIGMFEHVGPRNYRAFFRLARRNLRDDGLLLLQSIGRNVTSTMCDPWVDRYIFPNGVLPSARQITAAVEGTFVLEDWHSFGPDYDKTLMAWHANFEKAWPLLQNRYDERFRRMWNYYLLNSAGAFRARCIQLWQIVASKEGVAGGYRSLR